MKKVFYIIIFISFSRQVLGQAGKNIKCKSDTFNLILAYETGGQFGLDDMIIKESEFVEFDNNKITLLNYKKGVYRLPTFSSSASHSLKSCGVNLTYDSIIALDKISQAFKLTLDSLKTKTWSKTNSTFAGKRETLTGEKIDFPPLAFNYKIFQIKFIAVYLDTVTRNLINMDKKTKKEKEIIELNYPLYLITKVLDTKTIN